MAINEFLHQYFITPALQNDASYNIVNTPVYGIIFAAAVFLVYKILKKLEIPINRNFFIAALPYVLFGGLLRALRDAGVLKSFFFIAPLQYLIVFAVAFSALLIAFYIEKTAKIPYWKSMSASGFAILAVCTLFYRVVMPFALLQILGLTAVFIAAIYALSRFKPDVFTAVNQWVMASAMFDACSTFIAVTFYSYGEKHVLPNFFFGLAGGAWVMLPLKFFVVLFALYVIDKYEKDEFFRNFIKFAIITVTLGPGVRNTLRLAMGV